jgi:hypothetical protein
VILSREIRNAELAHLDSIATQRKPNLCRWRYIHTLHKVRGCDVTGDEVVHQVQRSSPAQNAKSLWKLLMLSVFNLEPSMILWRYCTRYLDRLNNNCSGNAVGRTRDQRQHRLALNINALMT